MKCKNCANYKGDCGNHFRDSDGHICWDTPSESMYDGVFGDTPKCYVESEKIRLMKQRKIVEELSKYPRQILEDALNLQKNGRI